MNHDDIDLETRLAALEARAPGTDRPSVLPSRGRRGRFAISMAMAPVFALAIVATATAGAVVLSKLAEFGSGVTGFRVNRRGVGRASLARLSGWASLRRY